MKAFASRIVVKSTATILLIFVSITSFAQKKSSFDIAKFTIPSKWQETTRTQDVLAFGVTDEQKGTFLQVALYASITSGGNALTDFESVWQELVVARYKPSSKPEMVPGKEDQGWIANGGAATFNFEGTEGLVMLVTTSGHTRCLPILIVTNNEVYMKDVESFLGSVQMVAPEVNPQTGSYNGGIAPTLPAEKKASTPAVNTGFTFSTTNFDDGWTSTVQEDWIEVVKGNVKVLIHYPNKQADDYNPDAEAHIRLVWNLLTAPRYSSAPNLYFKYITGWESIQYAEADAVERATGKKVHVVLFRKNFSGGTGKFLEVITPDKQTFDATFGAYNESTAKWEKLEPMQNYNKFAVSAADLNGKWSNEFSSTQHYVNIYTGNFSGMTAHASRQNFEFGAGSTYKWDIVVADGAAGNMKFDGTKSNGKFSVPNPWQVTFSDIQGKPKTYDAYFVCVKGARILLLDGAGFGKL